MPSARYGDEITIMKEMGWSWAQFQAAPSDLVDEIAAMLAGRTKAEREEQRRQENAARRKR